MSYNYLLVDLYKNKETLKILLEGQKAALSKYGLQDAVLSAKDFICRSGTFGIIATSKTNDEVIGGLRIYTRGFKRPLPLESEGSFLPKKYRGIIKDEPNLCELRGLWVSPNFSGDTLGIKITNFAILSSYEMGYTSIVATAQLRTYKYIGEVVGYEREMRIPTIPFPNENFETIVGWHRKNVHSVFLITDVKENVPERDLI